MILYRILTNKFTCGIETDNKGLIIRTAPILKKFKDQNIHNLKNWITRIHGKIEKIK